ncbi:hypothetical protein [Chryseobacterium polytrichastri]|uniref:Uncharacterized protein n=1 Tax=Chryseobacterium polytrichastri TaxID=1302687 RepID=A0A1M6T714_9FLAO|nr:hypothetical protein [Chryseobacterium polytrichastri]SHK52842.1 hypothetical protein SAMN05444267_10052 [Chryseobacterium polytrichastri]
MSSKTFHETSRFPLFIVGILIFQFIVTTFILTKNGEFDMTIVYITVPLILLFTFSLFTLNLTTSYFEYSFFPFTFKSKKIEWSEIKKIQIVKTNPLFDFGGWGIRLSGKYGKSFIMGNKDIIFLQLKNGKKRSFSIKDKEKLMDFFNENNISYEKH